MTHEEQRIWLIRQLLDEETRYRDHRVPDDVNGQKDLLRALMNVRLPKPISEEFLTGGTLGAFLVRTARYAVIVFVIIGVYPMVFPLFEKIGKKD